MIGQTGQVDQCFGFFTRVEQTDLDIFNPGPRQPLRQCRQAAAISIAGDQQPLTMHQRRQCESLASRPCTEVNHGITWLHTDSQRRQLRAFILNLEMARVKGWQRFDIKARRCPHTDR